MRPTHRVAFTLLTALACAWPTAFAQVQKPAAAPVPASGVAPPGASAAGDVPPQASQPLGCLIEPQTTAEVGAPRGGVVESVSVERGQAVKKGQTLAVLRSEVERANVESARSRANAEAEIRAAMANRDVARLKMRRTFDLVQLGFASQLELDQVKGEFEVADQRLAQARELKQTAQRELASAQAQLAQSLIRSPLDGVVVDRLVQPGERVDGKAAFRLAALNPLRVEMIVPVAMYGKLSEGQTLNVVPDVPNGQPLTARVVQVDRVIDAASGTFRARLALPNPNRDVPAGIRCRVANEGGTLR